MEMHIEPEVDGEGMNEQSKEIQGGTQGLEISNKDSKLGEVELQLGRGNYYFHLHYLLKIYQSVSPQKLRLSALMKTNISGKVDLLIELWDWLMVCLYLRRTARTIREPTVFTEPDDSGGNVAGGDTYRQGLEKHYVASSQYGKLNLMNLTECFEQVNKKIDQGRRVDVVYMDFK